MGNLFMYHVFKTNAASIAELESQGFCAKVLSTDGLLTVVDKQDTEAVTITDVPTKPSYVLEEMPNWPCLSHAEARQLASYQATTQGASDGWFYSDKGIVE